MQTSTKRIVTTVVTCMALAAMLAPAPPDASARPAKRSQKQRTIDRHMFTAEYFLLRERDLDAAVAEYKRVLRIDRNHVKAALALAEIEIQRKQPRRAVSVLDKLGRRLRTRGEVWRALARAQAAAGDSKAMVAACKKALAIDNRDGEAHWMLLEWANSRYRGGDASAKVELAAAARGYIGSGHLDKGTRRHMAERVLVELSGDPIDLAVFDAKKAYSDAFETSRFGTINQKMAEARKGFETCVAHRPEDQECHYYLGLVRASVKASEHYDVTAAKASLRKAPDRADARVELARLLRIDDDLRGASRELAAAIALAPDMAAAHYELGIVRKLDGNDESAVDSFAKSYRADPSSAFAGKALAELVVLRPKHPLVRQMQFGRPGAADVFSTDRFKAAVKMVEEQLGGVDENAAETAILQDILVRLRSANTKAGQIDFQVAVLKSKMVNAFALPNGSIYFTRGLFDYLRRKWPNRLIDANHDVLGHIMGHEMSHVIRRHTVQTLIYQEAQNDAERRLDPAVITHVTRLHEIEADRDAIVMAFLAGYHPRGGIEFMEASGRDHEIPPHLDHPTYEERVHYLEDYWTNDIKYAFVSFRLGVASLRKAGNLERAGDERARDAYAEAAEHFVRFRNRLEPTREVLNNLGIAYAKLGVMEQGGEQSPLGRWHTRFSIEAKSALKYVSVTRGDSSAGKGKGKGKARVPWQLREARSAFEQALARDPAYLRARINLALVDLAVSRPADAYKTLAGAGHGNGEVALIRGIALAEQGKHEQAGPMFRAAYKNRSLRLAARFNLARSYALAGKATRARFHFEKYLAVDKQSAWAKAARRMLDTLD